MFSLGGVCVKMVPWNPLAVNSGRCLISSAILFLYLRGSGQSIRFTKGTLLGALFVFCANILYILSNQLTTAANAILLQYTAPIFIILIMWLFFHEQPKRLDLIVCVVVFGGILCFFLDGLQGGRFWGNAVALLSGLAWGTVFILNKLPNGEAFSATFMGHLLGGIVGLPFLLGEKAVSSQSILFVVILGTFQMGLAYVCFCNGMKRTAPVTASLIAGIEPVLNPILVVIFVGEGIGALAALGGGIVLVAVTVYNMILAKAPREDTEPTSLPSPIGDDFPDGETQAVLAEAAVIPFPPLSPESAVFSEEK